MFDSCSIPDADTTLNQVAPEVTPVAEVTIPSVGQVETMPLPRGCRRGRPRLYPNERMKSYSIRLPSFVVEGLKQVCTTLGKKDSEEIRKAMERLLEELKGAAANIKAA